MASYIDKQYIIGIYVRESRDDNGENIETIETQRDLLVDYIKRNNLGSLYKVYIDDNMSGSNFDRRGIGELQEDIKSGKINMVLLKDLSRLGRNNAKTLLFLDFLEEHNVRVLTYDGRYDSIKDNDTVGIETWFNERYIKDISRKIRTNIRYKIQKGEFLGHPPYGYKKSAEEKNTLYVDNETAHVVMEIFRLYREGMGYGKIARYLEEKGLPSPGSMKKGLTNSVSWNEASVRRILCNRVYTGDTVQGTSERISFKSRKSRRLPENRWVVTPNTHEAIISREDFEEAQRIRNAKRLFSATNKGVIHPFRGIIYCGNCQSSMFARKRTGKPMGYICSNYAKNGKKSCNSHFVRESTLKAIIISELLDALGNKAFNEELQIAINKELSGGGGTIDEVNRIKQQITAKQKQQDTLYLDRLEGKISEQLFERVNKNLEDKLKALETSLEKIGEKKQPDFDSKGILERFTESLCSGNLTYDTVSQMVEKIVVFEPGEYVFDNSEGGFHESLNESVLKNGAVLLKFKFHKGSP